MLKDKSNDQVCNIETSSEEYYEVTDITDGTVTDITDGTDSEYSYEGSESNESTVESTDDYSGEEISFEDSFEDSESESSDNGILLVERVEMEYDEEQAIVVEGLSDFIHKNSKLIIVDEESKWYKRQNILAKCQEEQVSFVVLKQQILQIKDFKTMRSFGYSYSETLRVVTRPNEGVAQAGLTQCEDRSFIFKKTKK